MTTPANLTSAAPGRDGGKRSLGDRDGSWEGPWVPQPFGLHDPEAGQQQQEGPRRLPVVDHLPGHGLHQPEHGAEMRTPLSRTRVLRRRLHTSEGVSLQVSLFLLLLFYITFLPLQNMHLSAYRKSNFSRGDRKLFKFVELSAVCSLHIDLVSWFSHWFRSM